MGACTCNLTGQFRLSWGRGEQPHSSDAARREFGKNVATVEGVVGRCDSGCSRQPHLQLQHQRWKRDHGRVTRAAGISDLGELPGTLTCPSILELATLALRRTA